MATSPYQDSIVAFIDILGWSDLLRQSKSEHKLAQVVQVVERLTILAKESEKRREEFNRKGFPQAANTRFSYFSDTVVLSCPADTRESGWMIWEVQLLCDVLLLSRRYSRGAIVRGELRHTETLLFGPALVEAYEIEKTVAKYPRLVVTAEAAPFVVTAVNPSRPGGPTEPQWSLDVDGIRFLELFSPMPDGRRRKYHQDQARKLREVVKMDLLEASKLDHQSPSDLNHQAKYGWMLRYLDGVLGAETAPEIRGAGAPAR
jgi:hypothetical protein